MCVCVCVCVGVLGVHVLFMWERELKAQEANTLFWSVGLRSSTGKGPRKTSTDRWGSSRRVRGSLDSSHQTPVCRCHTNHPGHSTSRLQRRSTCKLFKAEVEAKAVGDHVCMYACVYVCVCVCVCKSRTTAPHPRPPRPVYFGACSGAGTLTHSGTKNKKQHNQKGTGAARERLIQDNRRDESREKKRAARAIISQAHSLPHFLTSSLTYSLLTLTLNVIASLLKSMDGQTKTIRKTGHFRKIRNIVHAFSAALVGFASFFFCC